MKTRGSLGGSSHAHGVFIFLCRRRQQGRPTAFVIVPVSDCDEEGKDSTTPGTYWREDMRAVCRGCCTWVRLLRRDRLARVFPACC
ncbi:hypothetical protein V6Z12_D12G096000 [Gossypium hirsutum]